MARPAAAREKVLAAYVEILLSDGERAATLDAVAAAAGVSKGGLLYHFGSKEALVDGLVERMTAAGEADIAAMRSAREGPVAYYLRSSGSAADALSECYLASMRLTGDAAQQAAEALGALNDAWYDLLLETLGDADLARTVLLLGDGLYLNALGRRSAGRSAVPRSEIAAVERVLGRLGQAAPQE